MNLKQENQKLKNLLLESLSSLIDAAEHQEMPAERGWKWFDLGLKIHNLYPNEAICGRFREIIRQ